LPKIVDGLPNDDDGMISVVQSRLSLIKQTSNMAQQFDPETAGNAGEIEMQFAVKTVEHLEVGCFPRLPLPPASQGFGGVGGH